MIELLGPVLLALAGGHAVADYGLQSAYVAEFKNRTVHGRGDDGKLVAQPNPDWFVTLGAHCLIHAFVVLGIAWIAVFGGLLLNGDAVRHAALIASGIATALGWLEFAAHFAIDHAKGQKRFSYRVDQGLHYACKLGWLLIIGIAIA